jgi:two-component system NtrC family sensor kinase
MKTGLFMRALLWAALPAALLSGWLYLYLHSHAVDARQHNLLLTVLRGIRQVDTDWTADVLRAHNDLHLSYDRLAQPLRPLGDALADLRTRTAPLRNAELDRQVDELAEAVAAKAALVDRFKAQNSLFKNSLRYVPTAHRDIAAQLQARRDASLSADATARRETTRAFEDLERSLADGTSDEQAQLRMQQALDRMRGRVKAAAQEGNRQGAVVLADLDAHIDLLVGETLRYSAVPERDAAAAISAQIGQLRLAAPGYPEPLRETVENLLSHLGTLLQLREQQGGLLRDISAVPVGAHVDGVSATLARRVDAELAGQNRQQGYLLAYSALVLLLVVGGTGFILYRNATERRRLSSLVAQQTAALKENEGQLVHAQRMAAVGEMVASIAHEVNTPLAAVKSGLQSARELLPSLGRHFEQSGAVLALMTQPAGDAAARAERQRRLVRQYEELQALRREIDDIDTLAMLDQLMETGVHSVEHISRVVVNMLNFSRLDRSRVSVARVEEGLDATLAIANHLLGSVRLHKRYGDTLPIRCDMSQINQVVLNLVKNAAQAVPPQGGEIRVSTAMQGPAQVRIEVADNGCGIAPDVLPRIWDPFFTTKPSGQGTGLGLSTCRRIVAAHGGTITAASRPGQGSTFAIVLPAHPPAADSRPGPLSRLHEEPVAA